MVNGPYRKRNGIRHCGLTISMCPQRIDN
jgi:hypothetical protein